VAAAAIERIGAFRRPGSTPAFTGAAATVVVAVVFAAARGDAFPLSVVTLDQRVAVAVIGAVRRHGGSAVAKPWATATVGTATAATIRAANKKNRINDTDCRASYIFHVLPPFKDTPGIIGRSFDCLFNQDTRYPEKD